MKTNAILMAMLGLLLTTWSCFETASVAEHNEASTTAIAQSSSTPPQKKAEREKALPTPLCSPLPTPRIKEPIELSLEDQINYFGGTPDFDCDGVCNSVDNCLTAYNPDQEDSNGDGKGDACDLKLVSESFVDSRCDQDGDGIPDQAEREKTLPSPTPICSPQPTPLSEESKNNPGYEPGPEDELNAGLGTLDWDCDGICNNADNCIFVFNPDQKDGNNDGKGNACDPKLVDPSFKDSRCDRDGDGIVDLKDNCPAVCNPDQKFVDVNKNNVNDLCDSVLPNFVGSQSCAKRHKVKPPKPPRPTKTSTK